jgi:hypothetical protein
VWSQIATTKRGGERSLWQEQTKQTAMHIEVGGGGATVAEEMTLTDSAQRPTTNENQ